MSLKQTDPDPEWLAWLNDCEKVTLRRQRGYVEGLERQKMKKDKLREERWKAAKEGRAVV